jgi:hypothetical protein
LRPAATEARADLCEPSWCDRHAEDYTADGAGVAVCVLGGGVDALGATMDEGGQRARPFAGAVLSGGERLMHLLVLARSDCAEKARRAVRLVEELERLLGEELAGPNLWVGEDLVRVESVERRVCVAAVRFFKQRSGARGYVRCGSLGRRRRKASCCSP